MKVTYNVKTKEVKKEEYQAKAKTEENIKKYREQEIKNELEELDKIINRATEDLYVLTNLTPYESITKVINRKNELRNELKEMF